MRAVQAARRRPRAREAVKHSPDHSGSPAIRRNRAATRCLMARLPRAMRLGLPAGGPELILAGGAAYFAWEHEQGRHGQAHMLGPICWLNRLGAARGPEGCYLAWVTTNPWS